MTLTRPLIDALRTNGTFTTATIEALGLSWDTLEAGWVDRLTGTEVSEATYAKALAGVGVTKRKRKVASQPELF